MQYKYDANDVNSLVKEGDYEAIIERMEVKTTPNGKNKLSVMYRIRTDVEQPYKNKCVFESIWAEKDHPEVFNRKRINRILGTQEIEEGKEFPNTKAVIDFLEGCALIIHVSIDFDEYHGEDVNVISYYKKSKIVPKKIEGEQKQEAPQPFDGDALPF